MDDPTARKTFHEGIDNARDLITVPRHSAPSEQLLNEIAETRLDYSDPNETTFTNKFFGVFQREVGKAKSNTSKADFATKAYIMVLTPKYAQINVHWVEIGEGEGEEALTYHMHCIKSYALNEQDNLRACRAAVNNILDWGLGERDKKIKALLNRVLDCYKTFKAAKAESKDKDKSVDKSPGSKKRRMDEVDTGESQIC
ncbi:MAG: hypothetical protein Q9178_007282 [Gyalolechia marmorata]